LIRIAKAGDINERFTPWRLVMRHRRHIEFVLTLFCLFLLAFAECSAAGETKPGLTKDSKGPVTVDSRYPFDFPNISQESVRQNYVKINYTIHKNKLFRFSVLVNKTWDGVKVAEPAGLPRDGSLVEIGLFNLYSPNHDQKGDLTAQMAILIGEVPKGVSAADYLDKQTIRMMKGRKFKTVQSKTMDTKLGLSKDTLISYSMNGVAYLSRMCAFKVKYDTKEYMSGEKHLLYLIQMNAPEKNYEKFGAEAFYVAKVTFQPE
jgi:hypothetical protein